MRRLRLHAPSLTLAGWALLILLFGRTDLIVAGALLTIGVAVFVHTRELIRLYRHHHDDA